MTPADGSGAVAKFVEAVKDLPAWLFSAFAVASAMLLFVPVINAELSKEYRPWLVVGLVVFGVLSAFKWINLGLTAWRTSRAEARARKTFHLTPIEQHCFWSVAKQADGSMVTQIVADFAVKNQSAAPIGLTTTRVIKPKIRGEIVMGMTTVRAQRSSMHGTAYESDHRIAPGTTLPARSVVMIRGVPRQDEALPLVATFGIGDEDGNEQRVVVSCKGRPKPQPRTIATLESATGIADAIEKSVVAVLQAELSRYEKNGRHAGGLGSIFIVYQGRQINQIGTDMWTPNSPIEQEIVSDPEHAQLHSDNLDALLALHGRLATDEERERLVNALLTRLDEEKGYARVGYLIVCTLWKLGFLNEGLEGALFGLPENDIKDFGLSNVLMMFNGLLRYRHPDFTVQTLDVIERFLQGSQEHAFRISPKIAAIRARRLMQSV